jgi:protein TonB
MNKIFLIIAFCLSCTIINAQTPDEVFTVVERMPEYPGGQEAMSNFLVKNLVYPKAALDAGIEGKVYVKFIVEIDGTVTNVEAKNKIEGGCSEEAVRVVSLMPKWKPGIQNGKPVRVTFTLPLNFKYK